MPHAIGLHDPPGMLGHVSVLHRINAPSARLRRPNGQDATAGAHVHDNLILEQVGVATDCRMVGGHAVVVGEHLLLVVELAVGAEVVGEVRRLGLFVAVEGGNVVRGRLVAERRVARCR